MAASVIQPLVEKKVTVEKLPEQLSPGLIKLKEATGTCIDSEIDRSSTKLEVTECRIRIDIGS